MSYETDLKSPHTKSSLGGAYAEIFGLGAFALLAMVLLAFGYNTRERDTATARGGITCRFRRSSPMARTMSRLNYKAAPPTSSNTGQGVGNGDQPQSRQ